MPNTYYIQIFIEESGTLLSNGGKSKTGHMWFKIYALDECEAPPLKRSVSLLNKAKQPQLTRKAFVLRTKDTSCPKHPFFGIVKVS